VTVRRIALVVAAAAVAGLFGWGLMTALGRFLRSTTPPETAGVETPAPPPPAPPGEEPVPRIKATLFFVSEDGQRLSPVEREVPLAQGPVAQARALLEALFGAEPPSGLSSAIPAGTVLRGLFISQRNEAFVDLDPAVRAKHSGGSMQELLTVYCIVNTLAVNVPSVEDVQILIGGKEADTLAGHVDLRRPLRKNESLINDPTIRPQP
jgi:spore germination protein GerM